MAYPRERVICQGEIGRELCLVTLVFSRKCLLSIPGSSDAMLANSVVKLYKGNVSMFAYHQAQSTLRSCETEDKTKRECDALWKALRHNDRRRRREY
jgi:hypothetical protein